jgi:acyl transferase domain-containing protein/surfactin synthase thioesterase subunit/acyl carrier protein
MTTQNNNNNNNDNNDINTTADPVAIVGIACRLPGEAVDLEQFWKVLISESETCTQIPDEKFNIERYSRNADERLHPISKTSSAHFLKDPIDEFDAEFFGISRKEAASMDPQHRLLLQSTYHALEDSGLTLEQIHGTNTAVYVGVMQSHYTSLRTREALDTHNQYSYMNTSIAYSAARLSYYFNLTGPAFSLDTMCSSSMVALHLGVQSLKNGESDMAIAAGVNLNFMFDDFVKMSIIGACAPDGRSKAFSANANGYAKGDGVGVVILKKLSHAIRDGDRIHAVIRGTGVNHDGKRKNGITVTSSIAQKELFERVYADSDIDPAEVHYLESHTTGTLVGDPIEASALGQFFGKARREAGVQGPVKIGSVKANIGHTEAMSGIASVAKVLMMFKKKQIPATVLFDKLNPKINFDDLNLQVITKTETLPDKCLIGASSFGMGGTNGHIILESYEQQRAIAQQQSGYLLLLSAKKSDKVLIEIAKNLKQFVNDQITNGADEHTLLTDVCYTSAIRRSHHDQRVSIAFKDLADFNVKIDAFINSEKKLGVQSGAVATENSSDETKEPEPKTVFVFSGQGPQWFAMGRHLYASEPVFRESIHRIDRELSKYVEWSLVEELITKDETTSRINQTDFAQPGIFAIQVSIYELLKSLSVTPDIVVGHSVGEVASAYVSGALSFEDAVQVIYARSRLQHKCSFINNGRMLAVNISEVDALSVIKGLEDKLSIAAINSETSVTISGDEEALKQVVEIINNNSRLAKASKVYLRTSAAFHSVHMDPIRDELLQSINITPRQTTIPLFSTVTGDKISGTQVDAEYWWQNVRQAVLFEKAISNILKRYDNVYPVKYWIEISPHPVLSAPLKSIINPVRADAQVLSTFVRKEDENIILRNTIGGLYISGYKNISWNKVFAAQGGSLISLPLYPFQKTKFWMESSESLEERTSTPTKYHPLLGNRKIPVQGPQPIWRNHISLSNPRQEFLKDHVIQGSTIYPFAGYIEQAVAAITEFHGISAGSADIATIISLKNFNVGTAMVLKNDEIKIVETILNPSSKTFQIVSKTKPSDNDILITADKKEDFSSKWVTHAFGQYEISKAPVLAEDNITSVPTTVSKATYYDALYDRGLMYGPAFQGIVATETKGDHVTGIINTPDEIAEHFNDYIIHPSLVDSCFQAVLTGLAGKETMIPVHMRQMSIVIANNLYGSLNNSEQQIYTKAVFHQRVVGNTAAVKQLLDLKIISKNDQKGYVSMITIDEFAVQELASSDDADQKSGLILTRTWEDQEQGSYATIASPAEVAEVLKNQPQQENYIFFQQTLQNKLKNLAALYALNAIRTLVGDVFTVDQLAGRVAPQYRQQYINYLVTLLESESLVTKDGEKYTVSTEQKTDLHFVQYKAAQIIQENQSLQAFTELVSLYGVELPEILSGRNLATVLAKGQDIISRTKSIEVEVASIIAEALIKPLAAPDAKRSILRVLQVGSGSVELTSQVIAKFTSLPNTQVEYVFAEESEEVISNARNKFAEYEDKIKYIVLDLASPIVYSETIQAESFDIIIATSAVNDQLQQLLVPHGVLVALQTIRTDFAQFISGLKNEVSATETFNSAGFVESESYSNGLVQTTVYRKDKKFTPFKWLVFADDSGLSSAVVSSLISRFDQRQEEIVTVIQGSEYTVAGNTVTINPSNVEHYHQLVKDVPNVSRIVFSWALNIPELKDQDNTAVFEKQEETCYSLAAIVQALQAIQKIPEFFVITAGAQSVSSARVLNIHQAPVVGFMHSAATDYFNRQQKLIDIDADFALIDSAESVAQEIMLSQRNKFNEVRLGPNSRKAIHFNKEVPQAPSQDTVRTVIPATEEANFRIAVPESRLLRDVFFEQIPRPEPQEGEVEVKIISSAINFKDILKIRGLHPISVNYNDDAAQKEKDYCDLIGLEAAGEVTKIGPNSRADLKVGDRVVYYSMKDPLFKSYSIQQADYVVKIPDNLSFDQAASVPIVFMTAYYCLFEKAKLQKGQSVLIHCASGGVGLSAIQLCHNAGATVFATAGTEQKRKFLKEVVGVEHVFNSRNAKFYDEIMRITEGKGVDMIINSISGDMLVKSVDLLATSGHFFELGKRDIFDNRHINLYKLRDNCAFHIIDLELALQFGDPKDWVKMLEEAMRQYQVGLIKPLQVQSFDLADLREAFELHQKATSIGKLALNFGSHKPIQVVSHASTHPVNERNGTYIITGGTGGVGLTMCKWFIKHKNIKNILLMSRRSPAADVQSQIDAMNARGVTVRVVNADVTIYDQVKQVIENIASSAELKPLRGIIHSAAVIEDALAQNMTRELIEKVLRPKIRGAYNLHLLTRNLNLEFFTLTSSMSNVMALTGQTHYNAANNFLDTLAYLRTQQGLVGMSASLTAVSGAGFVARNKIVARLLEAGGVVPVHVNEIIELLEVLQNAGITLPVISHKNFIKDFKGTYLPSSLQRLFSDDVSSAEDESAEAESAETSTESILTQIHNFVAQVLGNAPDTILVDKSLNQLGFDSLMSVEVRNWVASKFKFNVPLVELLQESVLSLSQKITASSSSKKQSSTSAAVHDSEHGTDYHGHSDSQQVNRITPLHTVEAPRLRLFCFPFLGGSSQEFKDWSTFLPEDVDVYGVDYLLTVSDRESIYDWTTLIELVYQELKPIINQDNVPYAFYGHSLGGSVAFETTRYIGHKYNTYPAHLFVGAMSLPGTVNLSAQMYKELLQDGSLSDATAQKVIDFDLLPGYLLKIDNQDNAEKLESIRRLVSLPKLIAEFKLNAFHDHTDDEFGSIVVPVPLTIFSGTQDKMLLNSMDKWNDVTSSSCRLTSIEGPHLFICEESGLKAVTQEITQVLDNLSISTSLQPVVSDLKTSPRLARLKHVSSGEELNKIDVLSRELEAERNLRIELEQKLKEAERLLQSLQQTQSV